MQFNKQIIAYSGLEYNNENHSHSHPAPRVANKCQKSHKRQSPQAKEEVSAYLQIASLPIKERIDPKELRYVLLILPHGIRACGGQFSAEEAHAIAQKTKGWSWNLDADGRLQYLAQLEALLDRICKRSARKGGEG